MSSVINNNIQAMIVLGTLTKNSGGIDKSLKKASSGEKITSAEDDASAWSISERMRVRMRSIDQATQNAQNDNSMMEVAEGALSSTLEILRTLKERAINSANDSNTDDDRKNLQKEVDGLIDQVDDNALVTFNGKSLIDGTHNLQTRSMVNVLANDRLGDNIGTAKITDWMTKTGESLDIQSTDKLTISFVWQGKAFAGTYDIGTNTMSQILASGDLSNDIAAAGIDRGILWTTNASIYGYDEQDKEVSTPGEKKVENISPKLDGSQTYNHGYADTFIALDEQIAAFNLSVTDAEGNVRKTVNSFVDNFKEVIRAHNKSDDNMLNFHVGAEANVAVRVGLSNMSAQGLALKGPDGTKVQVTTKDSANAAIGAFDTAISRVLDEQTKIGAIRTRLEYAVSNLTVENDNVQNAESVIRDADMAKTMVNYTRNNVMMQASQAMLAQANQNSSSVLGLLQ